MKGRRSGTWRAIPRGAGQVEGWGADGGEGKPVKVKYRNPFLRAIWSGSGARPPYWVKRIMDERGWTLGEFKQSGEYDVRGQKIALNPTNYLQHMATSVRRFAARHLSRFFVHCT